MRMSFHFRWIPFLATAMLVIAGLLLGNWQTRRAEQKQAIEQAMIQRGEMPPLQAAELAIDAQPEEYRRVIAEGEFIAGWPVYLENRPYEGKAGFHLLMPLRIRATGQVVLVLRGWFPRDALDRTHLPEIPVPKGKLRIEGKVLNSVSRVMQLGDKPALQPAAIVQTLSLEEFAAASRLPLHTFIMQQSSDTADGLVRDWPLPSVGIDKHRGYAFQWYALAITAFLFFLVTGFKRGSKP